MKISVKDLTRITKGQLILGDPKHVVTGAMVDSRLVEPGHVFFAFKGANVDGHDFAMVACHQGAACVVASHLRWLKNEKSFASAVIQVQDVAEALKSLGHHLRMGFKGPVVGVTGSNGKTTTKQMVTSILQTKDQGLSTKGNYNSQIGLPLVLAMLKSEDKWMVLEMGASEPGHIASLAEIARPTVGILTSIGPAHLATFGSLHRIAESKWELMESLPSDGYAIVPWGEPTLEPLIRSFKNKLVFFGENPSCPIRSTSVQVGEKTKFLLHIGSESMPVTLPMTGRCNVNNALSAAAAGWVLGYPIGLIVKGLEHFEPPKMRMEVIHHPSGAIIINDAYNANPASMMQAVQSLVESYPGKRKILALGSMLELGPESDSMHFNLGAEIGRFSVDHVFLTGKEMRNAHEGALSVGATADKVEYSEEKEPLVSKITPFLNEGYVILIKGSRGVHMEMLLEHLIRPGEKPKAK